MGAIKKQGRPKKEIDFKVLEGLCEIHCTLADVAGFFHTSDSTIQRRCREHYDMTYDEVYRAYSAPGRVSLRRWQFRMAEKNPTMAIWLGKQWLGQTDRIEQNVFESSENYDDRAKRTRERMLAELDEEDKRPSKPH